LKKKNETLEKFLGWLLFKTPIVPSKENFFFLLPFKQTAFDNDNFFEVT
jgi:hypothetical protein